MAQLTALTLTDAGYQLQVKAQTGTTLNFTRVALGDGVLSNDTSLNTMSALLSEKQTSKISSVTANDGAAEIKVYFSNKDLTESYYLRELGVFAKDSATGKEILYAVANAGDAADYMPAYGGSETIEQVFTIELSTGNAANVTAIFAESIYVLKAGDTMTGPLILSGAPTADLQATTKQYVDTLSEQSLSRYLPLAGGNLTGAVNEALISLASAETIDIGSANANTIKITGTTTITSLGTAVQGARRTVIFGGSLTLTYNATSLILPGAVSIPTRAGDVAAFVSLGNGNWQCVNYLANSNSVYQQVAVAGTSILVVSNDTARTFSSSSSYVSKSYTKSFFVKWPGTYYIYFEIKSPSAVTITVSSNYGLSTYSSSSTSYIAGSITTCCVPPGATITVTASIPGGYSSGYTGYFANCRLYVGSWLGTISDTTVAT
jgi:hypothetical protein